MSRRPCFQPGPQEHFYFYGEHFSGRDRTPSRQPYPLLQQTGATPAWGPRPLRCFRTLSLVCPPQSVETRAAKAAGWLEASEEAQMPPCSHSALSASSVTYKGAEPHSGAVEALLLQLDDPPAPTMRRLGGCSPLGCFPASSRSLMRGSPRSPYIPVPTGLRSGRKTERRAREHKVGRRATRTDQAGEGERG